MWLACKQEKVPSSALTSRVYGIVRQKVILNETAEFRLVLTDNVEIPVNSSFFAVCCSPFGHIILSLVSNLFIWNTQTNNAVYTTLSTIIMFCITMQYVYVISKESSLFSLGLIWMKEI